MTTFLHRYPVHTPPRRRANHHILDTSIPPPSLLLPKFRGGSTGTIGFGAAFIARDLLAICCLKAQFTPGYRPAPFPGRDYLAQSSALDPSIPQPIHLPPKCREEFIGALGSCVVLLEEELPTLLLGANHLIGSQDYPTSPSTTLIMRRLYWDQLPSALLFWLRSCSPSAAFGVPFAGRGGDKHNTTNIMLCCVIHILYYVMLYYTTATTDISLLACYGRTPY